MTPLLALVAILDLEALACLLWAFFTPSETGQAVFLWLSRERLALVAMSLFIFLFALGATLAVQRSREQATKRLMVLDDLLLRGRRIAPALIYLTVVPVLVALAVGLVLRAPLEYDAYRSWAPDTFPLLHSVVSASLPLVAFFVLAAIELAIFLGLRHRLALSTPSLWNWDALAAPMLVLLIALVLAFHWLVLIFQLRFFVNIPGWYWIVKPVPFGRGDLWFLLGAVSLFAVAYWLMFVRRRLAVSLLVVVALGWFLQMGVGLMGGAGLDTLRERYFTTYHQAYVEKAAQSNLTIQESIRQYDSLYGGNTFTTTKPPGLMAFYIGLERVVNGYPSGLDSATRYTRLSNVITWLFPLLAAGTAALLWGFGRRLLEDSSAQVPGVAAFLYVLAPSVALFTFFADQALYPALFLVGIWFAVRVIRGGSLAWSVVLGAGLYAAAFFAFTMLPLYAFAGIYLLLYNWKEQPGRRLQGVFLSGLGIALGTGIVYVLGRILLNYDFLSHFQRMAVINHNFDFYLRVGQPLPAGPEALTLRLGQIARAAWLNNLDYAAAIGFPIYLLFAVQAVRRLLSLRKPNLLPRDMVLLALLLSFLVLNLAGTAQGEVPRLWLFWLPMVALLAALELERPLRKQPWLLPILAGVQLLTLVFTFHFQDLRM